MIVMKKVFFCSTLMLLCLVPVMGQLKHVKGISNIGITGGINSTGYLFGIDYSHYLQPKWILNANLRYETGKVESTSSKNCFVSGGVDYTCFELWEFLYFNAGLSFFSGFEKLVSNEARVDDVINYTFGLAGNFNAELYFSSRFLFQIKAEQYYSPLSKFGKWFPIYSLSLKYCF